MRTARHVLVLMHFNEDVPRLRKSFVGYGVCDDRRVAMMEESNGTLMSSMRSSVTILY